MERNELLTQQQVCDMIGINSSTLLGYVDRGLITPDETKPTMQGHIRRWFTYGKVCDFVNKCAENGYTFDGQLLYYPSDIANHLKISRSFVYNAIEAGILKPDVVLPGGNSGIRGRGMFSWPTILKFKEYMETEWTRLQQKANEEKQQKVEKKQARLFSIAEVSAQTDISANTLRTYLDRGILIPDKRILVNSTLSSRFSQETINAFLTKYIVGEWHPGEALYSSPTVAKQLGVNSDKFNRLVYSGRIKPDIVIPSEDATRVSCRLFTERAISAVELDSRLRGTDLVRILNMDKRVLTSYIKRGVLVPDFEDERHNSLLARSLFKEDTVNDFLEQIGTLSMNKETYISTAGVALLLGVKSATVSGYIKSGQLSPDFSDDTSYFKETTLIEFIESKKRGS